MNIQDKLPLFRKLHAFTVLMLRAVPNMPRIYRYTLGQEAAGICWNCLDLASGAAAAPRRGKQEKLLALSAEFDRLNLRLRVMQELKIISASQYAHWQENYLFAIGQAVGGWLKWAKGIGRKN